MAFILGTIFDDFIKPFFVSDGVTGGFPTSGPDIIDGGEGADTLDGGDGDDIYIVDNAGDFVNENFDDFISGVDGIESSVSYSIAAGSSFGGQGFGIENITLTGFDDIDATGNFKNNVLIGNFGANILDGGEGADTLIGGDGDDTYIVDNASDVVIEDFDDLLAGTDTIISSVTYFLGFGLENLTLSGVDSINAFGNFKDNVLIGNDEANSLFGESGDDILMGGDGADFLDGGFGSDVMMGGDGNDVYVVDDFSNDVVIEQDDDAFGGIDTVLSSRFFFSLATGNSPNTNGFGIENITLVDFAFGAEGNSKRNILTGNDFGNFFIGSAGSDKINGGLGFDSVGYSNLGTVVSLGAFGVVKKGTLGTDRLTSIEQIFGSDLQGDTIDLSGAVAPATSTFTDLNTGFVLIEGGSPLPLSFSAFNFENVNGSRNADTIIGNFSNNKLTGGGGNDFFAGSFGNDVINGGVGFDVVDYTNLFATVTLSALGSVAKGGGFFGDDSISGAATDRLISVEQVNGSFFEGDTIDLSGARTPATGTITNLSLGFVTINGSRPPLPLSFSVFNFEYVIGSRADDIIIGDFSNNRLSGGAGNDAFGGSSGFDTIDGGDGFDSIDYTNLGVTVTLGAFGALDKQFFGSDSLFNVETIIGSFLLGDTVDHSGASVAPATGTTTNLLTGAVTINGTDPLPLNFTVSQFENVIGSGFADTITGNAEANTLVGGVGEDTLDGGDGDDVIFGDLSSPIFTFNGNRYTLTSSFTSWTQAQAQAVSLGGNLVAINDDTENQFLVDTFGGFEFLWIGFTDEASEGTFNWVNGDPVTYTNWADGEPNDAFGSGEDYAHLNLGEPGKWNDLPNFVNIRGIIEIPGVTSDNTNDVIIGSSGNDTINGGFGTDTVTYHNLGAVVTLGAFGVVSKGALGALGTDSLVSIETIVGSSLLGDTIDHSGASAAPATGTSTNLLTGVVTVNGTAPLPLSFNVDKFENVIGSAFNDTIIGNSAANNLDGGIGNDSISGDSGNDTLSGGDGNDSIGGGNGNDSISGGNGNDSISGSSNNDTLSGGDGNDTISGGSNNDILTGGSGNDFFVLADRGSTNRDAVTDFSVADDTFRLANALDASLSGAISPGIKGLTFDSGNTTGSVLSVGFFFKGAGFDGAANSASTGIYVNTTSGDIFYNDATAAGSFVIANVLAATSLNLTSKDFVYSA
jgi:Ca2+-binding RTX toxin-like protein